MKLTQAYIDNIINTALNEDINYIDVTTDNLISEDHTSSAYYIAKDTGVLCGIDIAKRVFELTKGAGVTLTAVGATFPYGIDPYDSNLRLAPTYPTDNELALACEILVLSIKLAALEKVGI
jgi:hypothetical protein